MKKARKFISFLSLFPMVPGRVWVDAYSVVALYRFIRGLPIDVSTFALVLGTYAVSKLGKKYVNNTEQTDA